MPSMGLISRAAHDTAVVLPGALKRLHIPRRFHHADDRRVPLGAGADGADLSLGVVLADAAAVELGVRVLDGRSQAAASSSDMLNT